MASIDLYSFLTANDSQSFYQLFNIEWDEFWKVHITKYSHAEQLKIGNRLRPKLLYWGYALTRDDDIDTFNCSLIYKTSILIELIHKASIILDDLIDNDDTRHGKLAFHSQYSASESILFANYLVNKSLSIAHKSLPKLISDIFFEIIENLVNGALDELNLNDNVTKQELITVIENETISLIKNSLVIGGYIADDRQTEKISLLSSIGYNCGLLFQILNDLEPFSNKKKNIEHKGNHNLDISKNRKNIVKPYIYTQIDIIKLEYPNKSYLDLYHELNIFEKIDIELNDLKNKIYKDIEQLKSSSNKLDIVNDFEKYINALINICYSRL